MQSIVSFVSTPQGRDILASLGILVLSELHGWGKGGSLFQSFLGMAARFCTKYATPDHQALVGQVLKAQGVSDIAVEAPAAAPSA